MRLAHRQKMFLLRAIRDGGFVYHSAPSPRIARYWLAGMGTDDRVRLAGPRGDELLAAGLIRRTGQRFCVSQAGYIEVGRKLPPVHYEKSRQDRVRL